MQCGLTSLGLHIGVPSALEALSLVGEGGTVGA